MKNLTFIFWGLLTISNCSFGQQKSFEGVIKYRTINTSYLNYGDTVESTVDTTYSNIYHKNGNYVVMELNSNGKQVFLRKSCKIYLVSQDEVQVFPGISEEPVIACDTLVAGSEILGYSCRGVSLRTKTASYMAYFSPEHFMGDKGLKNCSFWNLKFLNNKIPLYSVFEETNSYKLETIALDIVFEPVDDALFVLPENAKNIGIIKN